MNNLFVFYEQNLKRDNIRDIRTNGIPYLKLGARPAGLHINKKNGVLLGDQTFNLTQQWEVDRPVDELNI